MDPTPDARPRRRVDYPRAARSGVWRWVPSWRQAAAALGLVVLAAVGAVLIAIAVVRVPQPNDIALAQTTTLYWNDGTTVLGRIGAANRTSVALDQVPEQVQQAVLAAEDREFYDHTGFSPVGIVRAVWHNVSDGGDTQGGSTITQQYAKNAFLTQDQTFSRKLRELILSVKLELTTSKAQILADYLNTVYYGRGAYGIEAAAQAYFGVPAADLSVEQGAVLAALLQSPSALSPENNPQALRARWAYILDGMVDEGWLTADARTAMRFPEVADFQPPTDYTKGSDGYLFAAAQQQLLSMGYSGDSLNSAGLNVVTTFDRRVQAAAVTAVDAAPPAYRSNGVRIGLAAVDPHSGAVPALYGGPDYQLNRTSAASELRGLGGSSFLPFGLAAGLNQGLTLDSDYSGASPVTVDGATVANAGGESYGKVTLLYATVHSLQTPYVQMNDQIGAAATRDAAVSAGIPAGTPGLNDEVTNVIGEAAPTALEAAGAYGTFAARGERVRPSVIQQVREPSGDVTFRLSPATERAFDADVADRVTAALRRVVTYGDGAAANTGAQPLAGKTGVSTGLLSEWFVGYAPQLAAAVMVVRQDSAGNPITLSGVGGANELNGAEVPARIFGDFMGDALAGGPVEPFAELSVR
ncbi:MAG: penicillin-binding protein [Actinobacteria bacterium]|nr:MAG: penicillin-binding protein [Actinomycetota bacterium]